MLIDWPQGSMPFHQYHGDISKQSKIVKQSLMGLGACRKNVGRSLPGPGLPLSLDLLERVMDTLELASASLGLPQVSRRLLSLWARGLM